MPSTDSKRVWRGGYFMRAIDTISDTLPLTQEFLSEMLGVRRTTVTLAARMLQNAGVIRYRRGHIKVLDREGLEAVSCECYGVVRRNIARVLHPEF